MSAETPPLNDQYVFRRREFEELPSESQRRWHTAQPVHGARQNALQQQRHRVKQKYTNKLAVAWYQTSC